MKAFYVNGALNGGVRVQLKGGDVLVLPDGSVWLTTIVSEPWAITAGWTKLIAVLQTAASPLAGLIPTVPDVDALVAPVRAAGGGLAAAVVAAGVARLSLAGLSVLANGWTMGSEGFAAVTITGRATATAGLVDSTGIAFVAGLSGLA